MKHCKECDGEGFIFDYPCEHCLMTGRDPASLIGFMVTHRKGILFYSIATILFLLTIACFF